MDARAAEPYGKRRKKAEKETYVAGALGPVERKRRARELERHGRLVLCGDMICPLEEPVEVRVVLGLYGPAIGRVDEGGVGVVNGEVHRKRRGDDEDDETNERPGQS